MSTTLRPATPADAPRLAQIHVTSWRETYLGLIPDDLLDRMTNPAMLELERRQAQWATTVQDTRQIVTVAELNGEPVAFCSAGSLRPHPAIQPPYDAELYTLYALRAAHGHGLGRALLTHTLSALRGRGHRGMALWVLDVNPTRQFYRHLGGSELGEKIEGPLREVALGWLLTGVDTDWGGQPDGQGSG